VIYEYDGSQYPDYLKTGNAMQFIAPAALHFCRGRGIDVGAGKWPLPGAIPIDLSNGDNAMQLPDGKYPYVFSSHCLEHISNPVAALEHWKTRIQDGGVLFLYLPHPAMSYWRTTRNRKHLHEWQPGQMAFMLRDLGFVDVINSERDLAWSFAVVGFVPNG
jgi:SAM-dependent methyltransferase